jgi:hypothetical protein
MITVEINGAIVQARLIQHYLDGDVRVEYRGRMYIVRAQYVLEY